MRQMDYFGTLGPACADRATLKAMFDAGMTGVRLNLSHSSLKDCEEWIAILDEAGKDLRVKRKLVIDLQGPELRCGILNKDLLLVEGETVLLSEPFDKQENDYIPVPKQVLWEMTKGQKILLDDGKLMLEVTGFEDRSGRAVSCEKPESGERVVCSVIRGGKLSSRKSIALPGCEISLPTLTPSDIRNLGMAGKYGVTGVMLPFVRGCRDLVNLRNVLREANLSHVKIYAKIENKRGVDRLEELVDACDEIVIARGDLGNSVELYELPKIQEEIGITCRQHNRRFMVVTQMLGSMEHNPVPTRAEVNDIYQSVKQGASSVMLTAETAVGQYPVQAMQVLVKTAQTALK
ncbi:MAG: pyruvate kinase [Lachnospiraceae bacterium]